MESSAIYDGIIGGLSIILLYAIGWTIMLLIKAKNLAEQRFIELVPVGKWKKIANKLAIAVYAGWLSINTFLLFAAKKSEEFVRLKDTGGLQHFEPYQLFFPFRQIFYFSYTGDPLYAYDYTEFLFYIIIFPATLWALFYYKDRICKNSLQSKMLGFIIKTFALWVFIVFLSAITNSTIAMAFVFVIGLPISIYIVDRLEKKFWPLYRQA